MKVVGLTGGIGSGKSYVAEVFRRLGVPVYVSDTAAKRLMQESTSLKQQLQALLGEEIYLDGQLDRAAMAKKIFNAPDLLAQVNAIVHPAVGDDFKQWLSQQEGPYALKESAILFETGLYKNAHANVLVTAPLELRLKRVMQRDGSDEQSVRERMDKQWSDEKKIKLADFCILNDGKAPLLKQILAIHEHLCQ